RLPAARDDAGDPAAAGDDRLDGLARRDAHVAGAAGGLVRLEELAVVEAALADPQRLGDVGADRRLAGSRLPRGEPRRGESPRAVARPITPPPTTTTRCITASLSPAGRRAVNRLLARRHRSGRRLSLLRRHGRPEALRGGERPRAVPVRVAEEAGHGRLRV